MLSKSGLTALITMLFTVRPTNAGSYSDVFKLIIICVVWEGACAYFLQEQRRCNAECEHYHYALHTLVGYCTV